MSLILATLMPPRRRPAGVPRTFPDHAVMPRRISRRIGGDRERWPRNVTCRRLAAEIRPWSRAVVHFYKQRGTVEQRIKEGKEGTHWPAVCRLVRVPCAHRLPVVLPGSTVRRVMERPDPTHARMVELGAEHGREALRLGADLLREQLASLSQDADLTFLRVHVNANMVRAWPRSLCACERVISQWGNVCQHVMREAAGFIPSRLQEITRTPKHRRKP